MKQDIRWIQRFGNYRKALSQLEKFTAKNSLSELEKQGLIKAFEYTYELAWNTMKDYMEYQGIADVFGSRDVIREAFRLELIREGEVWMNMLKDRNRTSHTYNEETADEIARAVIDDYHAQFKALQNTFEKILSDQNLNASSNKWNSD